MWNLTIDNLLCPEFAQQTKVLTAPTFVFSAYRIRGAADTSATLQCWCGKDPELTTNSAELSASECDYPCDGNRGEMCGGRDRISAYIMTSGGGNGVQYVGCFGDAHPDRAMPDAGKNVNSNMTNEVSISFNSCFVSRPDFFLLAEQSTVYHISVHFPWSPPSTLSFLSYIFGFNLMTQLGTN